MQIFKFGGASLQNPLAVKEFSNIVTKHKNTPIIVVVSAMGKITQALEEIFQKQLSDQPYEDAIEEVYLFHLEMIEGLLSNGYTPLKDELDSWKIELIEVLKLKYLPEELEKIYSKVIAWGELLSSRIIYYYLTQVGIPCTWVDARKYIKTKSGFMNAILDDDLTQALIQNELKSLLEQNKFLLIQGFIGSDSTGATTTLGKEGSDFTGAILAAFLQAKSLTIWKDVPGIMSADPKTFSNIIKFDELEYETMATMSFYGAQVVHPKTIYPLATHNIPLHIRPFKDKNEKGTIVSNKIQAKINVPIYILRTDQIFIKLSLGEFIFFEEGHISKVLDILSNLSLRTNFIERTPYYVSICVTNDCIKVNTLLSVLKEIFNVEYYPSIHLLTIIGEIDKADLKFLEGKYILATQRNQSIQQLIY